MEILDIKIYDIYGNNVFSKKFMKFNKFYKTSLRIKDLSPGMYYIYIRSTSGNIITRDKFIVIK